MMLGDNQSDDDQGRRSSTATVEPKNAYGAAYPQSAVEQNVERPTVDLAFYWRLAKKHRFVIAGCFLAALALGATVTFLTTPVYTARATLQIDREAARVFNAEEGTAKENLIGGEEFFQTQYGLIRSRSLAERVIENLGLASSNQALESIGVDAPEGGGSAANQAAARKAAVLRKLQDNLSVAPVRGSRLVAIGYDNTDPVIAARIANGFAESFIQSNLDRKFESSSYARQFLEERILQTKDRLEAAERQLVAYAANQQIINVGGSGEGGSEGAPTSSLTSNSLVALNDALAQARAARVTAEERWRSARSATLMTLPDVLQNPSIQRLTEQRAVMDAEYQQKLSVYQADYPEMVRLRAQIQEADSQIQTIADNIRTSIRSQYEIAANQERSLQSQVTGLTDEVLNLRDRSVQYNILQRELDTTRTLYEGLLQRYKEVGITGGVTANNISIVDLASPPQKPSSPKLLVNIVLAALLGLGFGIVTAILREALDETIATPEDVEVKLAIPVLGVVPRLEKGVTPLAAHADIRSGFSEAYYSLRTALQFSTQNGAPSSLLISSARPSEGKSTTAFAISLNLARVGRRVLLVDADLRNPSVHRLLGVNNERGMSNLLSGSGDLASVVHRTAQENLLFIPCGPLPPNPAELWGSDRLSKFLADAAKNFDHVVMDGPPVLGFADGPLLAAAVEGVLFALESRGTRRGQARNALRRIRVGRANILGAVLTKFNPKTHSDADYDYAYDYNYGSQAAEPDEAGVKTKRER